MGNLLCDKGDEGMEAPDRLVKEMGEKRRGDFLGRLVLSASICKSSALVGFMGYRMEGKYKGLMNE